MSLDTSPRTPNGRLTWPGAVTAAQRIANNYGEPMAVETNGPGFFVIFASAARPELVCRIVEPQR